jgi:argininosuccinate synthase
MERIVLAYSGGLDTSVAITWLAETLGAEVIAVTLDLGQGSELNPVRDRALAAGATRAHVLDVCEEFARDYLLPALQAGALYEGQYPLAAALARPLMAQKLVELAAMERATAIAHGSTGKGNGQARLDLAVRALNPALRILAPARQWGMTRAQEIAYAHARGIPIDATLQHPYSTDANLWGRSVSCGVLEDPWADPPPDVFRLTRGAGDGPGEPASVELTFEAGVPVALNGVPMRFVELVAALATIAGHHGVGRIDMVEDRLLGIKSREIHEAPAAVVLHAAHRDLQAFVSTRELDRVARAIGTAYADLVYNGLWFTDARQAMDAFVASVQPRVTGDVRVKLFRGACQVAGRRSPHAVYDPGLSTYGDGDRFDHTAAEGFIRIWGLPVAIAARASARAAEAAVSPSSPADGG